MFGLGKLEDTRAVVLTRFLRRIKLRIQNRGRSGSELDQPIAPEIKDDAFYRAIEDLAASSDVRTILEIGASSGGGSTEALVSGALRNPRTPEIHTIEVSRVRFEQLAARYQTRSFVHPYHTSSVPADRFPSREEVVRFHREVKSRLQRVPVEEVIRYLDQDVAYLRENGLAETAGIATIKRETGIDRFDLVLIDGSEFTGPAELDEVYGARFLALDDTLTYKNHANRARLNADPAYRLRLESDDVRNGFAVFERIRD